MKRVKRDQRVTCRFFYGGIGKLLLVTLLVVQLVACGGGGGSGSGAGGGSAAASGTSALKLSWVAPVTRADGSALSLADIGGFNIYYGRSQGSYPNRITISDSTVDTVTLKNMQVGTYYIVMTTYDVNGLESGYSAVVKKSVS